MKRLRTENAILWVLALGLVGLFILFMILCPPRASASEIHGNAELGKDLESNCGFVLIKISYDFDIWNLRNSIYGD